MTNAQLALGWSKELEPRSEVKRRQRTVDGGLECVFGAKKRSLGELGFDNDDVLDAVTERKSKD